MILSRLKQIRLVISVLCLTLIALIFLDFTNIIPSSGVKAILYLQFVPSLLNFFTTFAYDATGFFIVILLLVLFGRIYCSCLCPLGIFEDVIGFVSRKNKNWRGYKYLQPHNILRYSILILTVMLLFSGIGFLLNLLDPFSSFGRIFSDLFRPVVIIGNNLIAIVLEQLGIHTLYRVRWVVTPISAGVAMAVLLLIVWLSAKHGRLYCNTICPVGTLLGLISKISMFQIRINQNKCKECKRCERVCKSGCIDLNTKTIDSSRCVACFNCLEACQRDGLQFKNIWKRGHFENKAEKVVSQSQRRGLIIGSLIWLFGNTGFSEQTKKIVQSKQTTIPILLKNPISPPGSHSIEHFISTCTACHLCVSACPSNVLEPSFLEYGLLGMLQPKMSFNEGHCNYECTICMDICPSGALLPLEVEIKKRTQIGVAKFIKQNCVVYTDKTNCGACSEHCPTKAVNMVPYPNSKNNRLVIPEVNPDYCIGCGGCEHACPTKPYKAIYVEGNAVHKRALKPEVEKIDPKIDYDEDFPF
jgi:ferredoxin